MSGQLVGEVLDAAETLQARGLSERGFHALVAIAEKCRTQTRQGSVRWDHICAGLYGASLSTAKRAVADLKSAGVIRVVKRGFNNHAGRVCAPIYEIAPLSERVTQVTQSPGERTGQIGERTGQNRERTGHPGDLLDGSIDGGARAKRAAPTPPPINPGEEPPRYCDAHMPNGTTDPCRDCGTARVTHDAWTETQKRARYDAIRLCRKRERCDGNGLRYDEHGRTVVCDHQPDLRLVAGS